MLVGVLNLHLDKKSYKGFCPKSLLLYKGVLIRALNLTASKVVDENRGDMGNFLVTKDSTHREFC